MLNIQRAFPAMSLHDKVIVEAWQPSLNLQVVNKPGKQLLVLSAAFGNVEEQRKRFQREKVSSIYILG